MEEALSAFLETKLIVLNSAENVKTVDMASANPSFQELVDRMDRLMSALAATSLVKRKRCVHRVLPPEHRPPGFMLS